MCNNYNKRFLISIIDVFSKYPWVVSLKDKKDVTITNVFEKYQMSLIANQSMGRQRQ